MQTILKELKAERKLQDAKWGIQNIPILDPVLLKRSPQRMCEEYEIPSETRAKTKCEIAFEKGEGTYMHVLVEELSEACSCGNNIQALRAELIQVAAVTVAMIECIDRNIEEL